MSTGTPRKGENTHINEWKRYIKRNEYMSFYDWKKENNLIQGDRLIIYLNR